MGTDYTDSVLASINEGANAVVPSIWKLEIVNALVVAERRKKLLPAASLAFLRDLDGLNFDPLKLNS